MCKEVITLRILLLVATSLFVTWSAIEGLWNNVGWNLVFGLMHLWQLGKIFAVEKLANVPAELDSARRRLFPDLRKSEFMEVIRLGKLVDIDNQQMIVSGVIPATVYLVLSGDCEVDVDGRLIRRQAPCILGEVSLISGQAAGASVFAQGRVRALALRSVDLRELAARRPDIKTSLLCCLSKQMALKLVPTPARLQNSQLHGTSAPDTALSGQPATG